MTPFKRRMVRAALFLATNLAGSIPAAASITDEEARALREQIKALTARLEAVETQMQQERAAAAAAKAGSSIAGATDLPPALTVNWKGSPQFKSDDRQFKVKGRIQADMGYVEPPPGSTDRGYGFSSEFRRIRLGGEGKLGDGFGYKLELELSDNSLDLVDTFVTYEKGGLLFSVGNQNQFQSLDELTGDTSGSFMERAAFTDAFNFERRLGLSVQYQKGPWLLQGGVFTDDIGALANDSDGPAGGDENNSFSIDGRLVHTSRIGDLTLHIGASGHWRTLNRVAEDPLRYRQRPYLHGSNSRILATSPLGVKRELNYGVELAAIRGRWHAVAETHWLTATLSQAAADPTFFGGYVEIGYFLTRDSRSFAKGQFDRTEPSTPLREGGIGAVQVNLRYDHLDLNDGDIKGGRQDALLASVIWTPVDYLRFNANYGYMWYGSVPPGIASNPEFGIHVTGLRMELDF